MVPANCVAAEYHPTPSVGRASTNCIHPAVVKNQDPMKHNRFERPAPAVADILGRVAIAKNVEPIANNQHCLRSVATWAPTGSR
jgi:hypothetical protein